MRRHRFLAVTDALADHDAAHQTGDTRIDMHHGTSREIKRAFLEQEPGGRACGLGRFRTRIGVWTCPIPDHVRHRQVG